MLLFLAVFVGLPVGLVCLGGALMFAFGSWAPKDKVLRVPIVLGFLVPVGFAALLFFGAARQMEYDRELEFSPSCSRAELVGDWVSVRGKISLRDDGTLVGTDRARKKWVGTGCSLVVDGQHWEAFRQKGELKLLAPEDAQDDPDSWRMSGAFSKAGADAGDAATRP